MAQQVEHVLGKDEVPGSNPGISSKNKTHLFRWVLFCELVKGFASPSKFEYLAEKKIASK